MSGSFERECHKVIASQLKKKKKKKKPEPSKSKSSKPQSPHFDYEIGSETDSYSDGAGQVHAANAKPDVAVKEPLQTKSKASATPAIDAEKTKKVAKNEAEKEEKPKVTPFQRVFTKENELILVRALEEKDVWADMDTFYEFVKNCLSISVTCIGERSANW
ncbi:hypothetical protein ACLB2K_006649 [Fragaria x ananassa]